MSRDDTRTELDGTFEPHRLRTITDMRRSKDDRLVGGVASGAAKHLNIDPVLVRVVIAVLTIVGFAGAILYLAAWFLLPAENEERSIAADWFKLDKNEEQVRVAGLVAAAALAVLAIVGDRGYVWWGFPWLLVPIAALYYVFAVRPRRRAATADLTAQALQYAQTGGGPTGPAPAGAQPITPAGPRERSWALTWLTLSVTAIAVASTRIYADYHDGLLWTTYLAVALGVVAIGLLVSTFFGHGGPLIGIGILLSLVLAVGSALPGGPIGAQRPAPVTAAEVQDRYQHGIGLLEVDLSGVSNPQELLGRRITIEAGIGETLVIVPEGLDVRVDADLTAGEVSLFGRKENGTDVSLGAGEPSSPSTLTLRIDQKVGNIEVIGR